MQLRFQPGPTSGDVARTWFLMDPAFPARFPFEMFHRVGDINFVAVDSGVLECAIQNFSGWADKGFASHIFIITRLLTDHEHGGAFRAFTENGLRCFLIERAGSA